MIARNASTKYEKPTALYDWIYSKYEQCIQIQLLPQMEQIKSLLQGSMG
jgi:hypothetical protein